MPEIRTSKARKANSGSFKPGQSGNPGGRPLALVEVITLARQKTPEAIEALARIVTSGKSESAVVAASEALLSRAWGKPKETVSLEGHNGEGLNLVLQIVRAAP